MGAETGAEMGAAANSEAEVAEAAKDSDDDAASREEVETDDEEVTNGGNAAEDGEAPIGCSDERRGGV